MLMKFWGMKKSEESMIKKNMGLLFERVKSKILDFSNRDDNELNMILMSFWIERSNGNNKQNTDRNKESGIMKKITNRALVEYSLH